ncbi:MAG: hypothetical protein PVI12_08970 [Gammaproteobacteria bacterium]|jgi:hypothetical protein|nr:MAG: hypothetical protein AMJ59_21605 [Gammaproteobacteria bacterium SG8_31]
MDNIDFSLGMRRAVRQFQQLAGKDTLPRESRAILYQALDMLPSNPKITDLHAVIERLNELGCSDAGPIIVQALLIRAQK